MTRLTFTYHEVIDWDFTAITATVHSDGEVTHYFSNFERAAISKPIYANQSETFKFPSRESALSFMRSNETFHELPERITISDESF
jgi:hypothetical protein